MRESLGQVCHKRRWVDNIRDLLNCIKRRVGACFYSSPLSSSQLPSFLILHYCRLHRSRASMPREVISWPENLIFAARPTFSCATGSLMCDCFTVATKWQVLLETSLLSINLTDSRVLEVPGYFDTIPVPSTTLKS